jgi:hypothetical protein
MKIDNKRVFEIYEANAHLDKQEKADICNREFGTNYDESSFRKRYAVYRDALDRQIDNLEDEALERIVAKEWNIKKEQRKLAIAKMQLNKDTNTKAFGELIQEAVEQLEFPVYDFTALPEPKGALYRRVPVRPGEFYIFTHADLHYDGTFDLKTFTSKRCTTLSWQRMCRRFTSLDWAMRLKACCESVQRWTQGLGQSSR